MLPIGCLNNHMLQQLTSGTGEQSWCAPNHRIYWVVPDILLALPLPSLNILSLQGHLSLNALCGVLHEHRNAFAFFICIKGCVYFCSLLGSVMDIWYFRGLLECLIKEGLGEDRLQNNLTYKG